ncbi:MAG: metallophosphoesterase family protein [Bacteroidales bacterium]|nr:metallophosphoesterase family protein [Bacteroidales bacterium]MDD4671152.1 metallophosphoesterase family protein [Bacteroidales bacterium]
MPYIGLLSDTHCYFDDKLKSFFKDVDVLWHAGDFGNVETANKIAAFKPLVGVYGNCDGYDVRAIHPYIQLLNVEGMKILMMHIGGYPGRYDSRAFALINAHRPDVFICGHSHILKVVNDRHYNMLTINPGAAGIQGFHLVRTALRFHIEDGKIQDMEVGEWERKKQIEY